VTDTGAGSARECVAIAAEAAAMTSSTLRREVFRTSRLLEFCNKKELTAQTGHEVADWPLVIIKELIDNALDACEEAGTAPDILVDVSTRSGEITVVDNGPGIPAETITDILDYSVRVSSREAYVSPTRGAQGNALKTILAMPFALDGTLGEVRIETQRVAHRIGFAVDQLRQEPRIDHETGPSKIEFGAWVVVKWPDSACSILADAKARFLQIADDFAWLNPHLRIYVTWDGEACVDRKPSDLSWQKWKASDPTSPHWYDLARFERYTAAHVNRDQDTGRRRLVREFVSELRGLSATAKGKRVLDETGMARSDLAGLFGADGAPRPDVIGGLLTACKKHSRPVKPKLLGLIGADHLLACFEAVGVAKESFQYRKAVGEIDGLPWVVETAFGYCPHGIDRRRIIAGVNFSVGIGNPFRSFRGYGGEGLEAQLNQLRASPNEPIVCIVHYTCPRVDYTDRGKTALVMPRARSALTTEG
jgi:DNA topoisomerase VI subunit B